MAAASGWAAVSVAAGFPAAERVVRFGTEPDWAEEIAETRSDLRILEVPLMPSWPAIAWSSGIRRLVSAPVEAEVPAAGVVCDTKDHSPSISTNVMCAGLGR